MINVVEKFLEIRNKTEQTTGDDKHLELLSALKLKRLIVLVKLNWPQGNAKITRDLSQSSIFG